MSIHIRPFEAQDITDVHTINEAAVPGVNSLAQSELAALVAQSAATLVAHDGARVHGFVLLLTEGLDYESLNYAWISERYPAFAYVDRVAVAGDARGTGVGRALYQAAFDAMRPQRQTLMCEVNLAPPNPGSMAFHAALGFRPVGERWQPDGEKGVVYLQRAL